MTRIVRGVKAVFGDPARVTVCESCGSACVCDTACRAGAARDRALTSDLSVGLPS